VALDTETIRQGFPALNRTVGNHQAAYLDGPGGTQVHESVISAMADHMRRGGSNTHGPFVTSAESEAVVDAARRGVADLFGSDHNEVVFGQNMTSLTYVMSRALARTWSATGNVVVTRLDHDANVAPWIQAAASVGVEVRFVDVDTADGSDLDVRSLDAALDAETELVAFTHASNATGTIPNVRTIIGMAHAVGAMTYLDAVHYAPHGSIDVKEIDTDFLVSSAYKWFGPHTGCLYGKAEHLESIQPFKLRPSPNNAPDRWETGTQSFESLAGVAAAVDYVASHGSGTTRREQIVDSFAQIKAHEKGLATRFLAGVAEMPHITLVGRDGVEGRTPTFAVDVAGHTPNEVAAALGDEGIFVWSGNYYAYEIMQRLGRPDGLVRIGFVHYNTLPEVDRVLDALERFPG
jgi:cysteine desulfurase family protein (TIGR01976 family)